MTSVAGAAQPVQALALPARPALAPPPRPPAGGGPVLAVPLQELALDESWGGVNVTYLSWGGVNLTRCTQLPLSREAKATCFGVGAGSTGLPTPDMGTKVHRIPCCSSDSRGFVPAGSPSLSTMRGKTSGGPHAMGSMCDWSSNYTPGAATAATSYRAATPICRWAFMRQPGTPLRQPARWACLSADAGVVWRCASGAPDAALGARQPRRFKGPINKYNQRSAGELGRDG